VRAEQLSVVRVVTLELPTIDGARAIGAAVELRYLGPSPDVLVERLERRAREHPPIARAKVYRWFTIFDVPTEGGDGLVRSAARPQSRSAGS
jgi:hypothetical protein